MIDVDPSSPVPLYQQIADRIRQLVALGALKPGERLPPVRELAARARVNRNTAARAIQLLESGGLLRTRVGQGTFVEDAPAPPDRARLEAQVDASIDRLLVEAQTVGLPLEELSWRLVKRLEAFRRNRKMGASDE